MRLTDPSTLCLLLLAAMVVLLTFRTRQRLSDQQRPDSLDQRPNDASNSASTPDDLARWEVEMHEKARELSGQLDAKLSLLQALIAEADRAARRLEAAIERPIPSPSGDQPESTHPAQHLESAEPEAVAADNSSLNLEVQKPPAGSERVRKRDEIYELADYGFAPDEIARRIGLPVGEVELMLSLRGK